MDWRSISHNPDAPELDWQAVRSFGRTISGRTAVASAAAKWQPIEPLLVAGPRDQKFYPVLQSKEFRHIAFDSARKKQRWSMMITGFWTLAFLLLLPFGNQDKIAHLVLVAGAITAFLALDYRLVIGNFEALAERSAFIVWLHRKAGRDLVVWLGLMFFCGFVQAYLQARAGGLDPLAMKYGLVYAFVRHGQWWRLLTGPFFHHDVAHWLANLVIVTIIGSIASAISRWTAVGIFLIGVVVGGFASFLASGLGWSNADGYVGVSAGAFALMGWCAALGIGAKDELPSYFGVTMASFGALNLVLTALLLPHASTVAHAAGWLFGLGLGIAASFFAKASTW